MTGHSPAIRKSASTYVLEFVGLGLCLGLSYAATAARPLSIPHWNIVLSVGYLLLAGTLAASLLHPLRLPHLTAYILVGVIGGPHVLKFVDHETVHHLVPANTLAISLIALAGGLELEGKLLLKLLRSLFWSNLVQSVIVGSTSAVAFWLLAPHIPFTRQLSGMAVVGAALIWGMLATSRSPSATLAVLAQTRAKGPLARWSLSFVMSSDLVVVLISAWLLVAVRPLLIVDADWSMSRLTALGHEIIGSISLGLCLGLLLSAYLRFVGKKLMLILLVLGFVVTDGLRYVHFDSLLAFLTTGFVVRNLSSQGEKLLGAVSQMSGVVFVVFFATAGVHLDLPQLVALWPIALAFFVVRAGFTVIASIVSARIAKDARQVQCFGFAPLVSQAGLTLALTQTIEREFPSLGVGFRSLVIATVAVNEVIGPILFKVALDRTGETEGTAKVDRTSAAELEAVGPSTGGPAT